jgi:hypothetical protein
VSFRCSCRKLCIMVCFGGVRGNLDLGNQNSQFFDKRANSTNLASSSTLTLI